MILVFTFALILYVAENCVFCQPYENSNFYNRLDSKGDLLFVQLIFRHGDRTPLNFYKNDPWKERKYWDDEPGQLTKMGKQRQFELGRFMRQRYAHFLNSTYSEDEIYVQSSKIDRTIMSAECFLTGMYKSEMPTNMWNTHLPWQPYAVHTTPTKMDNLIHANMKCAAFKQQFDRVMESDEIKEFNRKHQNLYHYLSVHSGDKVENLYDTVHIQDTLLIEHLQNRSLAEWTKRIFPGGDMYDDAQEAVLKAFSVDTSKPFLAKIRGGFILKDILDRFSNKSKSLLQPDRKLWAYSGHDSTICRTLNTLGILEGMPQFSSCVIFEMRNIDNVPHIEIFLKNSPTTVVPLTIPHCGAPCPLANFYVLYENVLPTKSFEEECIVKESQSSSAGENQIMIKLKEKLIS